MKPEFIYRITFIFLLLLHFSTGKAQYFNFQKPTIGDEVFLVVHKVPEFSYGIDSLIRFMRKNIQYPYESRKNRISGRVHFRFIVDKNGHLTNLELIKGINEELDKEATRIMNHLPYWLPGEVNGHKVHVRFALPVLFELPICEYYYENQF